MPASCQELEFRACDRWRRGVDGGREGEVVIFVDEVLDWARVIVVCPYILHTGFVEGGVCFSEREGVFEEKGLVWGADRQVELCGEGGEGAVE